MICDETALANEPFDGGGPVSLIQPLLLRSWPGSGRSTNALSLASLKLDNTICCLQAEPWASRKGSRTRCTSASTEEGTPDTALIHRSTVSQFWYNKTSAWSMSRTSTDDNRSRTPCRPSSSAARRNANGVAMIRSDFERVPAKKSTVIFDRSTRTLIPTSQTSSVFPLNTASQSGGPSRCIAGSSSSTPNSCSNRPVCFELCAKALSVVQTSNAALRVATSTRALHLVGPWSLLVSSSSTSSRCLYVSVGFGGTKGADRLAPFTGDEGASSFVRERSWRSMTLLDRVT
mmetsp:Transcript_16342/g.46320  ORF Transcript_16342/g.46320 Transcript_16342/m.46320 type:complete len:289 (+) Transcript_16342:281-1147(+)